MQMSNCAEEYAKLRGLTLEELDTIAELAPFVSREQSAAVPALPDACYRALYEAAETRYNRMKALVCASVEAQMRVRSNYEGRLVARSLKDLGLGDEEAIETVLGHRSMNESSRRKLVGELFKLAGELKSAREDNERLMEMNRRLRGEGTVPDEEEISRDYDVSAQASLSVLQERVFTLELELNRIGDFRFEDEQRMREWQSVFDTTSIDEEARMQPIPVCSSPECQLFLHRLRMGLRRSVADAFIRDRVTRINGFFRRMVEPVERVRAEKDREIVSLRLRLKRLEQAACMTSSEADAVQLDERIVELRLKVENLRSEGARVGIEIAELNAERDRLKDVLVGLRSDEEEVRKAVEGLRAVKAQVELAVAAFEKQKEDLQFFMQRMDKYQNGELLRDIDAKYCEVNRLYDELAVLEERKYKLEHGIEESDEEEKEEEEARKEDVEMADDVTETGKRAKK